MLRHVDPQLRLKTTVASKLHLGAVILQVVFHLQTALKFANLPALKQTIDIRDLDTFVQVVRREVVFERLIATH